MNEITQQEQEIRDALRTNLHAEEPSDELMRKLRVAAQGAKSKTPWWRTRWTVACTAAAGALAIGLTMLPAKAGARTFERIIRAATQINAYQFSIETEEDGKKETVNIAGVGARFGIRTTEGPILSFDSGWLRVYDPEENVITRFKLGGLVNAEEIANSVQTGIAEGLKEVDLKKTLQEYEQKYGREHIKISPIRREGGRDVYSVDLDSPNEPERVHMEVDASNDLPETILVDRKGDNGAWEHNATMKLRFNDRVDPSMLRMDFPDNAKIVDLDLAALAGGKNPDFDLNLGKKPVSGKGNPKGDAPSGGEVLGKPLKR